MCLLPGDDANGCKLLQVPGMLQNPLWETQQEAVTIKVLSAHWHSLEIRVLFNIFLNTSELDKQIKCKKNGVVFIFVELFSKAAKYLYQIMFRHFVVLHQIV